MNPASGATVGSRAPEVGALRWSAGSIGFELVSSHPEVLERARVVFRPWLNGSSGTLLRARFAIERIEDTAGAGWRVLREPGQPSVSRTLDLALAAVEYAAVARLHDPDAGVLALHAALLSRGEAGVLLVGPKESGKSTLACALWREGWWIHSDDNAILEDAPFARGIPRRVSLRFSSRGLLGCGEWERIERLSGTTRTRFGLLFHPSEVAVARVAARVPVVAVAFLARLGAQADPGRAERLDAGRALLALAPYTSRREDGIARALEDLQPLMERVPSFDLGRGALPEMVTRIEEIVRR